MRTSWSRCLKIGSDGSRGIRPIDFELASLAIQLLVAAENAALVEGNATVAFEIGLDGRPRGVTIVQLDQSGRLALGRRHALRPGVAQAIDNQKQQDIDIGDHATGKIRAATPLQYVLE